MRRPTTLLLCSEALAQLQFAAFTRRALCPGHVACGDHCVRGTLPPRHHAGTNDLLSKALDATGRKAALAPRHYRIPACSHGTPHRECDVPRRGRPAVTGRCASDRPPGEHRHGRGSSSRRHGSPPCRAGRGSPPAPGPPRRDAGPRCRRTSSARPSHQRHRRGGLRDRRRPASVTGTDRDERRACVPRRREEEAGRKRGGGWRPGARRRRRSPPTPPRRKRHGPADHRESHHAVHRPAIPADTHGRCVRGLGGAVLWQGLTQGAHDPRTVSCAVSMAATLSVP